MPTNPSTLLRRPLRGPALRQRADLPALTVAPAARNPPRAEPVHDFLVPNPRPDLTAAHRSK